MPNDQVLMVCAFVYGFFDGTLNTLLTTMIGLSFTTEKDASGTISFLSQQNVSVQVVLSFLTSYNALQGVQLVSTPSSFYCLSNPT